MTARALMFQGTGSDVGKSLVVAGLARAFTLRGLKVMPFKPQNMSNNAAVTADGGEIGRAQALQARAANVPLSVHMNPVLLKPQSEVGSQVVVQGRVECNATAAEYQHLKPKLMTRVMESFALLRGQADLVLVEQTATWCGGLAVLAERQGCWSAPAPPADTVRFDSPSSGAPSGSSACSRRFLPRRAASGSSIG